MSNVTFDKLTYIDKLKTGGFTEDQARIHADALDGALRDGVATKSDLTDLKIELLKWLIPLFLAQAGLIVALVKLL